MAHLEVHAPHSNPRADKFLHQQKNVCPMSFDSVLAAHAKSSVSSRFAESRFAECRVSFSFHHFHF